LDSSLKVEEEDVGNGTPRAMMARHGQAKDGTWLLMMTAMVHGEQG